ncbi:mammalian cell entry protein [Methylovorus sp. MM2]|uniref:MlaD family protein n=1 Tax=Methylovorus sp. MM2 TaxID=1848038 RepID=UPI0007E0C4C2|nr:MlaD family protein [Methylovorus sp. MM2]OAM52233.1 mammalian cell entry protein [Methylovorus sp. MM2]
MENRSHAIAVGLFTLILGFALFMAFWWLSGSRESMRDYVIVSTTPVTGLSTEASVKFRGVEVGKVTDLYLDPKVKTNILIHIEIDDSLQLSTDAYAQIRTQGVTGLAFINLDDSSTTAPVLADGATIPLRPSFLDSLSDKGPELVAQFQTLLKSSSEMTASANEIMKKLDAEKLNKTVSNLEQASTKITPMLSSLTKAGNSVSGMMSEKNQTQFANTLKSLQQTADAAQPVLGELGETAKEVKGLAKTVEQSTSDLSITLNNETLPRINRLTDSLNQDVQNLNQLIYTIEDNPQSLLVGKPQAAPGPGEQGFKAAP